MSSDRYRAQVNAALGAVAVRPPDAFLWFGWRMPAVVSLVEAIGQRLHADFYGDGEPRAQRRGPVTAGVDGGSFVWALSQANCGRGAWHAGWRVAAADGDTITVVRPDDGLALLAPAQDCRIEATQAQVRVPKDLMGFSPGLYVALADTPWPPGPPDELVALCWSITAFGAVTLVKRLTFALNRAELAFRIELLGNPARYERGAGATLLLARADFAAAAKLLRPLLRALGPYLADAAPAFTKPLARGLAVAEEPANGLRFGEHRCLLLAEAIVAAGELGLHGTEQRLAAVDEHFRAAGLTLDAPYLQPGADDAYELS